MGYILSNYVYVIGSIHDLNVNSALFGVMELFEYDLLDRSTTFWVLSPGRQRDKEILAQRSTAHINGYL